MTPTPDERSRVANAARDLADNFERFEKSLERLRRSVDAVGVDEATPIIQAALDTPRRREAWEIINKRIGGNQ